MTTVQISKDAYNLLWLYPLKISADKTQIIVSTSDPMREPEAVAAEIASTWEIVSTAAWATPYKYQRKAALAVLRRILEISADAYADHGGEYSDLCARLRERK